MEKKKDYIRKGVPRKVLRYFPIIPRFRKMFTSTEIGKDIRWHSTHISQNGKMRHPVDLEAWKSIDRMCANFR